MPKSFSVKLKIGNKMHILGDLTKDTTIGIFKLRVGLVVLRNFRNFRIYIDDPPRLLDLSRNTDSIDTIGIVKDVILILEMKEAEQNPKKQAETFELVPPSEMRPRKELFCSVKVCAADINSGAIDGRNIGLLVRQPISGNASSLFIAIRYAITGKIDNNADEEMRKIVAIKLASEPERFNKNVLGMPNPNYIEWVLKPTTCGTGVECAILAEYYKTEIDVVHISEGVLYRFSERSNYTRRIFLTLKNSHYDVLYMTHSNSASRRTFFPVNEVGPYEQALKFARKKKWHNTSHRHRFKKDSQVRTRLSEEKLIKLCKQAKAKFEDVETAVNKYACIDTEDSDDDMATANVMENDYANLQQVPEKPKCSKSSTIIPDQFCTKSRRSKKMLLNSFKNENTAKKSTINTSNKLDNEQGKQCEQVKQCEHGKQCEQGIQQTNHHKRIVEKVSISSDSALCRPTETSEKIERSRTLT